VTADNREQPRPAVLTWTVPPHAVLVPPASRGHGTATVTWRAGP
jgi:hypothetical protein